MIDSDNVAVIFIDLRSIQPLVLLGKGLAEGIFLLSGKIGFENFDFMFLHGVNHLVSLASLVIRNSTEVPSVILFLQSVIKLIIDAYILQ